MFRRHQHLRRWSARLLLLWLFGIGSGVAHACFTPAVPAAVGSSSTLAADGVEAINLALASELPSDLPSEHAHHRGSNVAPVGPNAPEAPASAAKSNCQDFCSKAAVSIPSLKSPLGDVDGAAIVLTAVAPVVPAPAVEAAQGWVPRRDRVRAPPITLVYLRLAL